MPQPSSALFPELPRSWRGQSHRLAHTARRLPFAQPALLSALLSAPLALPSLRAQRARKASPRACAGPGCGCRSHGAPSSSCCGSARPGRPRLLPARPLPSGLSWPGRPHAGPCQRRHRPTGTTYPFPEQSEAGALDASARPGQCFYAAPASMGRSWPRWGHVARGNQAPASSLRGTGLFC